MTNLSDFEVFCKTIFAEATGESEEGQRWVGWVIKNRASFCNQSIKQVCLKPSQFECWNKGNAEIDKKIASEKKDYEKIVTLAQEVFNASKEKDPTGHCMHYNNPNKEYAKWTETAEKKLQIKNHVFYWFKKEQLPYLGIC